MNITALILTLGVFGFVSWIILQIPMAVQVRNIIIGVICLLLVIYVLQNLGVGIHSPVIK